MVLPVATSGVVQLIVALSAPGGLLVRNGFAAVAAGVTDVLAAHEPNPVALTGIAEKKYSVPLLRDAPAAKEKRS